MNRHIITLIDKLNKRNHNLLYIKVETYDVINKQIQIQHYFEKIQGNILIEEYSTDTEEEAIDTLIRTLANDMCK